MRDLRPHKNRSHINWVTHNLSNGRLVKGIITADDFDEKEKYAVSGEPNV